MSAIELDEDVARLFTQMAELKIPSLADMELSWARETMTLMNRAAEPTAVAEIIDRNINSDDHQIPIRIYKPVQQSGLPVIVFYHGGGWVLGSLDTHDEVARRLAKGANAVVVSVDYRLAPEHKFPAGFNDAYNALIWVAENAAELSVDTSRLVVAGDSAGGNLAAAVCLRARDEKGPKILYQSLWYPVTNLNTMATDSYNEHAERYNLKRTDMAWFRDHYLDKPREVNNPHVSPLLSDDFSDLPDAYIMTAGFDVLRDEGAQYARSLVEDGNQVRYQNFPQLVHGFMNMAAVVPAAQQAFDAVVQNLIEKMAIN